MGEQTFELRTPTNAGKPARAVSGRCAASRMELVVNYKRFHGLRPCRRWRPGFIFSHLQRLPNCDSSRCEGVCGFEFIDE